MARINTGSVIVGGLVAGLVINVIEFVMNMWVLADMSRSLMERMGLPPEPSAGPIVGFVILGFIMGFLVAWTYAAIRATYGPGPKTAFCAGFAVWVAAGVIPILSYHFMGLYGAHYAAIGLAYTLVELVIAGLVAGKLYKDVGAPVSQAM